MKAITLFGAAFLLVFLIAAVVSVYGFGQYEQAWGRGGSVQVEAWLALIGALVAMGSFGISSALLRRVHAPASVRARHSLCGGLHRTLLCNQRPCIIVRRLCGVLAAHQPIGLCGTWRAPRHRLTIRSSGPLRMGCGNIMRYAAAAA